MTLQYKTRDMGEDREWQQRIRLSRCFLLEAVDWWWRTDSEFPVDGTIASVLYVFSPRCNPFDVSETRVRQHLLNIVGTSSVEYSQTWPRHTDAQRLELVNAISHILRDAVERWNEGTLEPTIEMVNQQIIDQIVAQKYVTFHHHHTTRRDFGGFHGSG
jgi:hypothetical protein